MHRGPIVEFLWQHWTLISLTATCSRQQCTWNVLLRFYDIMLSESPKLSLYARCLSRLLSNPPAEVYQAFISDKSSSLYTCCIYNTPCRGLGCCLSYISCKFYVKLFVLDLLCDRLCLRGACLKVLNQFASLLYEIVPRNWARLLLDSIYDLPLP